MKTIIVLCAFFISACVSHKEPPPGWTIQYSKVLKEYRACSPAGTCFVNQFLFLSFDPKKRIIERAWWQYEFEREEEAKFVKENMESNINSPKWERTK
jgi:hypothetical protein